jgi:hypothetical protein
VQEAVQSSTLVSVVSQLLPVELMLLSEQQQQQQAEHPQHHCHRQQQQQQLEEPLQLRQKSMQSSQCRVSKSKAMMTHV